LKDEDEDELDEGEEFDDFDEVPVKAAAVSERADDADDAGNRVEGGTSALGARARRAFHRGRPRKAWRSTLVRPGLVSAFPSCRQGDMGRSSADRGRTAQALPHPRAWAAARDGQEASVDIVD